MTARLRHIESKVEEAKISKAIEITNPDLRVYTIEYPKSNRKLSISYHKQFPYEIEAWQETYSDFGQMLTTKATKKKRIMSAYWGKNSVADSTLRVELGLQ